MVVHFYSSDGDPCGTLYILDLFYVLAFFKVSILSATIYMVSCCSGSSCLKGGECYPQINH